jgi:hypothetical protein
MTPYVQNLFCSPAQLISRRLPVPPAVLYRSFSGAFYLSAFHLGATIDVCSLHQEIPQRPFLILPFGSGSATISDTYTDEADSLRLRAVFAAMFAAEISATLNLCAFPPDQFHEDCGPDMYRRKWAPLGDIRLKASLVT